MATFFASKTGGGKSGGGLHMRMNSKIVWGLAWAGLALVIAVPSADFLTNKLSGNAAVITSTTDPVKTDAVTTTRTANGITITPAGVTPANPAGDALDKFAKSGKALPDYITDDSKAAPVTPTQVAAIDKTLVATPTPSVVPPTPFPSWARPHNVTITPVKSSPDPVVIIDESAKAVPQPVIVDNSAEDDTNVATDGPVPPANIPEGKGNWSDPGLTDYLARRGLLDDGSSATIVITNPRREAANSNYDADGFFLSDGPNRDSDRATQRRARLRALFGDECYDEDTGEDLCDDEGTTPFELF